MSYSYELLSQAKRKFSLSQRVCDAFKKFPRHEFISSFSVDHENWLEVTPETFPLIYDDTTLLLYEKDEKVSTISQPSFVLHMLDLLDLSPGMRVFELGTGSGWNAAMLGDLVGKTGKVVSYEIIPEMEEEARKNLGKYVLPQVEIILGDTLEKLWDQDEFDRGIFTAGTWDLPGIFFDVIRPDGKLLFVLKTRHGDLLLNLQKQKDHFLVINKIFCHFVAVTGPVISLYQNDLSELYHSQGTIRIYPQGTMNLGPRTLPGRDMVFEIE